MNEEVFYGLDDSIDHKIEGLNSLSLGTNNELNYDKHNSKDTKIYLENNSIQFKTNNSLIEVNNKLAKKNKFSDEAYNTKRYALPCERKKINLNVWGILKEAVTKDLSKFCVPGKLQSLNQNQ